MTRDFITKMQTRLNDMVHDVPGQDVEFWFARELMEPLGYQRWENFVSVIKKVIVSCETTGISTEDHKSNDDNI